MKYINIHSGDKFESGPQLKLVTRFEGQQPALELWEWDSGFQDYLIKETRVVGQGITQYIVDNFGNWLEE